MNEKQSIHREIYGIFLKNPDIVYTTSDLVNIFNNENNPKTKKEIVTMILTRLHKNKLILRTPTQLADGYYYSLQNKNLLGQLYENHLLSYDFEFKTGLMGEIGKSTFDELSNKSSINLDKLEQLTFIQKYSLKKFKSGRTQKFLALLVGFIMCDGSISSSGKRVQFFFRKEHDAHLFVRDFKAFFPLECFRINSQNKGASYSVEISKGSEIAELLHELGAPKGTKVFQPFLIPLWIYQGSDEIKKIFLSTVIGNEGSAPSKQKWRIQFVLSKSKEHVPNLIDFLNQIRAMLYHFDITTSHIQLRKQEGRQFHGRFYIKGEENLRKFYNEFSFLYASEKQTVLEELIAKGRLRS